MKRRSLFVGVVCACLLLSFAPETQASCVPPVEVGTWVNVNWNTNEIAKARVTFECKPGYKGNVYYASLPYTYLELWGKGTSGNVYWGKVPAWAVSDGWYRTLFVYNYAVHDVYFKAHATNSLQVVIFSRSFDGSNRFWITNNWFRRQ